FHLPDGSHTDLLSNSVEGFFAGTPEEFLTFLQALIPNPSAPDPDAFGKAVAAHPAAAAVFARIAQRPIPASYAQTSYFAVHAFRFLAPDGSARFGRYQWVPEAGEAFLSAEEGAQKAPDFLSRELESRLSTGPAVFRLMLQIAAEGDPTDDCTQLWPADRPVVELGRLEISSLAADSVQAQKPLVFDPNNLTDGIEPTNDPILLVRKPAYADSFSIRSAEVGSAPY
ncbi:MAG TPA: catalase, partial [Isosphaeraceae bacterium]|nr:catalase [Isosphaeraceae bacterium]